MFNPPIAVSNMPGKELIAESDEFGGKLACWVC